jgi:branched-chain amino acid transport system ATP-binding protein
VVVVSQPVITVAPAKQQQTPEPEPILVFDDVSLSFAGVKALSEVSYHVKPRELFAIIGPNGAGKTSIFNVLSGVYRPQQGSVRFLGHELIGASPHHIADLGMSRTFQNIELFENLTVIDNLMLGRHRHVRYGVLSAVAWWGRAKRDELRHRERVEDIIDFLEIESYRKQPVGLLPYGLQKRVELGRALALEPKLLLLDEPVAGMNVEETEDMARFILDIRDELDIPMILVEHDMGLVMDLADRVMVLDFGQRIAVGRPDEVQRNPDVIKAYLGQDHAVEHGHEDSLDQTSSEAVDAGGLGDEPGQERALRGEGATEAYGPPGSDR